MTRQDARLVRKLHEHVHHGALDRRHVAPAADRVLEEDVAREAGLAVEDEREVVLLVARGRQRRHVEAAHLERAGHHFEPELVLVLDVVGIGVRAEDIARLDAPLLGGGQQRLERGPCVHVYGRAALLVRDEVGVRKPAWMQRPFDEHAARLLRTTY